MDGSIGVTETHCDIVAGSKRALVVALADTIQQEEAGLRLNHLPNTILPEVKSCKQVELKPSWSLSECCQEERR